MASPCSVVPLSKEKTKETATQVQTLTSKTQFTPFLDSSSSKTLTKVESKKINRKILSVLKNTTQLILRIRGQTN